MVLQKDIQKYITRKRRSGMTDPAIYTKLLRIGVDETLLSTAFQTLPAEQSSSVGSLSVLRAASVLTACKLVRVCKAHPTYFLLTLLVIFLLAGGAVVANWHKDSTQTPGTKVVVSRTIHDPNYTLVLPQGWQAGSTFHPGSGLSIFYPTGASAQSVSSLVVYVLPHETDASSAQDHVATKIAELSRNGATTEPPIRTIVNYGRTPGPLVMIIASQASDPANKTCYIFAGVDYGKVSYNVDVAAPASDCQGVQLANLQTSLQSLRPISTDIVYSKP